LEIWISEYRGSIPDILKRLDIDIRWKMLPW